MTVLKNRLPFAPEIDDEEVELVHYGFPFHNKLIKSDSKAGVYGIAGGEAFVVDLTALAIGWATSPESTAVITVFREEIAQLRKRVEVLERTDVLRVPLETLPTDEFQLSKKIEMSIRPTDSGYIASAFDIGIAAAGENIQEAIDNLKDMIVATYELLRSHSENELGPKMLRQWLVLRHLVTNC